MKMLLASGLLFIASVTEAQDFCRVGKHHLGGQVTLVGSKDSLRRQNAEIDLRGWERILDEKRLATLKDQGALVPLPESFYLRIDPELDPQWRWCRPETSLFLDDLAARFYSWFGRPLQVNSAVRTVWYQKSLMKRNGNAAPTEGERASPHLSGATVDIAKKTMTLEHRNWIRVELLHFEERGLIEATEEFNQAVFHITVYREYGIVAARTPQ